MKANYSMKRYPGAALVLVLALLTSCAPHWPQFRGAEQNNIAEGKDLPAHWNDSTNIRWTAELEGESWSSPIVHVDKVFTTTVVPVKTAPPAEKPDSVPEGWEDRSYLENIWRWEVTCHDLKTGQLLWKQVAKEGTQRIKKHSRHNFAAETPITDGKRLYVYFGMTGVFCYELDGTLVWEKDLGAFETLHGWGTGSSPVIYNGVLYMQVDNEESSFLAALAAEDGKEIWRVDRDEKTSYSTPFIWKNRSRTELVTGGKTARSYDPETGELLWELEMKGYYNLPSPVADKDFLYMGNTARRDTPGTLFCIRAGAEGDITPDSGSFNSKGVNWCLYDAPTNNPSPLLYNGLLYLVSSRGGEVSCLNAFNGKEIYKEKIPGVAATWASPWAERDRILFTDEKGTTHVFSAGKNFEYLHENTLDDKIWTTMAVARDAYILKGTKKMYCIGL